MLCTCNTTPEVKSRKGHERLGAAGRPALAARGPIYEKQLFQLHITYLQNTVRVKHD